MIDARYSAVVGSACSCVLEVGSDHEDRSSDGRYVGDTRYPESVTNINCTGTSESAQSQRTAQHVHVAQLRTDTRTVMRIGVIVAMSSCLIALSMYGRRCV